MKGQEEVYKSFVYFVISDLNFDQNKDQFYDSIAMNINICLINFCLINFDGI